jgi:predicted PurR-regulated permease PerM
MNGNEIRLAVKFIILALLLISVAFSTVSTVSFATSNSQLITQIRELYLQLEKISESGVNVNPQIQELNEALQLLQNGSNPMEAETLIQQVNSSIPQLESEASTLYLEHQIVKYSTISTLIVLGFLTYYFGPRFLWKAWIKMRSRWVVK